ncbi:MULTISPECIES: hypothetical protein [unclassified Geodermatophilus]
MNAWLLRASRWALTLVMGVLVAPLLVLGLRFVGDASWSSAVVTGVVVAVVCAPVLALLVARNTHDALDAFGPLPHGNRALVERAARRGPVPEDDEVRGAALRVVEGRLALLAQTRTRALLTTVVLVLLCAGLAVTASPWWWAGLVVCAGLLVLVLVTPARLRRRADLLRRAP